MSVGRTGYRLSATAALDLAPEQRRMLYLFTYLSALVAVQILHLALDDLTLNLGFSGGLTAGFVFSYYLHPRQRALTTYGVSLLAIAISVYFYMRLQSNPAMYGNYLGILLGILMVLLAFKAFAPGDFRFILMICVVFLLFSSVASYDLKFMLLLPLFLACAGSALYMANQVEVGMRVSGTVGMESSTRFPVEAGFFGVLLRAIGGIIALSVLVYILVPHSTQLERSLVLNAAPSVDESLLGEDRPAAPLSPEDTGGPAEVGLSQDFDLSTGGELSADPRPVLRVRSHRNGYLRAQVFDVYTGSGWVKSPRLDPPPSKLGTLYQLEYGEMAYQPRAHSMVRLRVPLVDFPSRSRAELLKAQQNITVVPGNVYSANDTGELSYDMVRQEITLIEPQQPFYFAIFQPFRLENISVDLGGNRVDQPMLDQAAILRPADLKTPHPREFTYTVYSLLPQVSQARLKHAYSPGPAAIVEHYTQLPDSPAPSAEQLASLGIEPEAYRPVTQRLRNFAVTLSSGQAKDEGPPSVWDKVQAIYRYLTDEREFTYTRSYRQLNPRQEVTEAFCLGTRQGYCRYFASSMAVLCRLNGIPARVVTGYAPGRFSLKDNAYIVHASNAHAWVEVYFDEYGWVTFDPSPSSSDMLTRGALAEEATAVLDFLQELFVIDPAGTQRAILEALAALWQALRARLGLVAGVVAVLLLAAAAVWVVRRRMRRRGGRKLSPENGVVAAYLDISEEFARLGVHREPSSTARAFLMRAAQAIERAAEPLARFLPVYERAAFSPQGPPADDLQAAQDVLGLVRECARAVREGNGK